MSAEIEEEMRAHIERVGCRDAASYREWCAANKLRDGLHKGTQEREREARVYDRLAGQEALKAARLLERSPEEVLRALFNGNAAALGVALERRPYLAQLAVNRNRAIIEARGRRNALPSAAPVGIALLPREEAALLVRSRRIVAQRASAERLTLPAYLR